MYIHNKTKEHEMTKFISQNLIYIVGIMAVIAVGIELAPMIDQSFDTMNIVADTLNNARIK
jgi:hypothetical protein